MLERARKFRTAPFPSEFNLLKLFVRNPVLFKLFLAMILLHVNRLFAPVRNLNDGLCEHLMSSGHLCYWKLPHVAFTIMESSDVFLSLMRASPAPCSTWKACRFLQPPFLHSKIALGTRSGTGIRIELSLLVLMMISDLS